MTRLQKIATEELQGWIEAGCDVRSVPDLVNHVVAKFERRKVTKDKLLPTLGLNPLSVLNQRTKEGKS